MYFWREKWRHQKDSLPILYEQVLIGWNIYVFEDRNP